MDRSWYLKQALRDLERSQATLEEVMVHLPWVSSMATSRVNAAQTAQISGLQLLRRVLEDMEEEKANAARPVR